ncbi:MAG: calcium/sodium antiporter [Clostridiales bacterium]|jgi:cation:H+ antiporter|nr:calcium/sodium antiporter [Clostridiales bacterium]
MELFVIIVLVVVGFALIIKGGDLFVDSAVWIAKKTKMPEVLIGATIVSIGTTLPEVMVSLTAAFKGEAGLALGNAVGSIFCNFALILGLGIAIAPSVISKKEYSKRIIALIALCAVLLIFILDDNLAPWESVILVAGFIAFMAVNVADAVKQARQNKKPVSPPGDIAANAAVKTETAVYDYIKAAPLNAVTESGPAEASEGVAVPTPPVKKPTLKERYSRYPAVMIILFFAGAAAIAFGANILVDNVSKLAINYLRVSVEVVGYTVVAFGTSLPEFITALTSLRKKSGSLSFGNIIGANIINGTLILGVCGIMAGKGGLAVADPFSLIAGIAGALALTVTVALSTFIKAKTYRWQGAIMLAAYVAYTAALVVRAII